jgi:hypothetical protein
LCFVYFNTGADLPGLYNPGLISVWEDQKLLVWGGDFIHTRGRGMLTPNGHLYEMKQQPSQRGNLQFDVTKYAIPGQLSPSRQNRDPTEQQGDIPEGIITITLSIIRTFSFVFHRGQPSFKSYYNLNLFVVFQPFLGTIYYNIIYTKETSI